MARRKFIIAALICAVLFAFGISDYAEAGNPGADPRCSGLTGAAFGMCSAATAVGCDNPDSQNPGCASIEDNFIQITGELPPWSLPPCPCGTSSEFIERLNYRVDLSCTDQPGNILAVNSSGQSMDIFSFYPGQSSKQTCGFDNTSMYVLTDDEAQSCINELNAAIENFSLTCVSN